MNNKIWIGFIIVTVVVVWPLLYITVLDFKKLNSKMQHFWLKSTYLGGIILILLAMLTISKGYLGSTCAALLGFSFLFIVPLMGRKMEHTKGRSLEAKIKKKLGLSFINMNIRRLWSKRVGGFISPFWPFTLTINSRWDTNIKKEAVIHEHVHAYYFIYRGYFVKYLVGLVVVVFSITTILFYIVKTESIIVASWISLVVTSFYALCVLVYNEKITFDKTHEIGKEVNVVTRQWSKGIATRYFIIYGISLVIMITIVRIIERYPWLLLVAAVVWVARDIYKEAQKPRLAKQNS